MNTRIAFSAMVLLAISFLRPVSHAAEQPNFEFGRMKNITTACEKDGVIWAVHYGEDKQGYVVYAIFNRGKGPSPVSPSETLRSDGSHQTALDIQIGGKKVPTPGPKMNLMVIVGDKVERGNFRPLLLEEFRKFLHDKAPLSIESLEGVAKASGKEAHRTSQ